MPHKLYSVTLTGQLDKHAALNTRTVTVRSAAPWFSEEVELMRKKKGQAETMVSYRIGTAQARS